MVSGLNILSQKHLVITLLVLSLALCSTLAVEEARKTDPDLRLSLKLCQPPVSAPMSLPLALSLIIDNSLFEDISLTFGRVYAPDGWRGDREAEGNGLLNRRTA